MLWRLSIKSIVTSSGYAIIVVVNAASTSDHLQSGAFVIYPTHRNEAHIRLSKFSVSGLSSQPQAFMCFY